MTKIKPSLPDYKSPPVSEVAVAVQFSDLHGFPAPYLGDLWAAFGRDEFPNVQNQEVIAPMPGSEKERVISFVDPSCEIPRVWFLSEDQTELIQFQQDRLAFNWRRVNDKPYPRYKSVIEKFEQTLKALEKFVKLHKKPLSYDTLELIYVNIVPFDDFGGAPNIGAFLKDAVWRKERVFLPEPSKYSGSWEFELPDLNGRMFTNAYSVQNLKDGTHASRLDIVVRGQYASPFDKNMKTMLSWYNKAHEHIVCGFDDLTTPEMHEKWGKDVRAK
ncbi:MAG: TIGR04255 family protein [Rhodospirillales bacterium]|nr:TIGR04255 family protein [Alphaproteobacteria bacterium]MCB9981574.1 TIGR04255 family protein [Rhodospirillales bacterium]